ncbi:MAG: YfhO family protein [Acidobacteriota bacterium]|nr:YfhO family protein [Acidobacteriota bacterium]
MMRHLRTMAIFLVLTILFYWKLILVRQYSLILGFEGTNQMYAWFQFLTTCIWKGVSPGWDPFTFSGHAFAGEMQTGAFYPLYRIFSLYPSKNGGISPNLYNEIFVLSHAAASLFMYALCRELRASSFASIVSGLVFSLGGILARLGDWPHLLESGLWLPLLVLCILKALRQSSVPKCAAWSIAAGLTMALSVLAGGLHFVIMQGIVALSVTIYYAAIPQFTALSTKRGGLIFGLCLLFALTGGAVQLLPSAEYSRLAYRFYGTGASIASERIPYSSIGDNITPQAAIALLFATPAGPVASGEFINPYAGVFPLLAAIIGCWANWRSHFVRYLAGLALLAYLYSWGSFSLLNGVAYALTPFIWMARESSRFMYLVDFSLAVLAAFGLDTLLRDPLSPAVAKAEHVLRWASIAAVAATIWPTVTGGAAMNAWVGLSLVLIIASWAVVRYVRTGHNPAWARILILILVLFDLNAFDWLPVSINERRAAGQDQLARLQSAHGAVDFLRSRPGPFRVEVAGEPRPNVGDYFGIETTWGAGVTVGADYLDMQNRQDLLNARYILRPAATPEGGWIYADANWKVYERTDAFPRAWILHRAQKVAGKEELIAKLNIHGADLRQIALFKEILPERLEPSAAGESERVAVSEPHQDQVAARVHATGRGLVVFSEMFYPGWQASVNGQPAKIWKVDGDLRALVVPRGDSTILMSYRPATLRWGAILSLCAFLGGGVFICCILWANRPASRPERI